MDSYWPAATDAGFGRVWTMMKKVRILNIEIDNIGKAALLRALKSGTVVTPNVDHLMKLQKDEAFFEVYRQSDYVLCDSRIVQKAAAFLGSPIKEKLSGSDLFPAFCDYHRSDPGVKIFLLGSARQEIVDSARENINHRTGREIVVRGVSPSFGFERKTEECEAIVRQVNASGATVLAVGVGAPKQEKWIMQYKQRMPGVRIFMAIGATIDFEAGNIKRAPGWMSNAGLEWLYRLVSEPGRLWRRYLVDDVPFFWLIVKQKLGLYKNPWRVS